MSSEPKVNILLVDDRPENLLALEAILESLGHNLVRATSGTEALKCILNQDFALILLDVQMPNIDGFETATLIRQRDRSRHTPIIFLTAFTSTDKMVSRGYSLGAVDYLFKPINGDILKYKAIAFVELYQKNAELKRQAAQLEALNHDLQQSEELFRSLSACSPIGIFTTDIHGVCTYVNPRFQEIYDTKSVVSWTEAIHPEEREEAIANWHEALQVGTTYNREFRILTPQNIERWIFLSSAPLHSDTDTVIGYVGAVEDITKRKEAEQKQIELVREQTIRKEAETANRLKDEFIATLSHELRTPLNAIFGWAKLLRSRKLDQNVIEKALETIERNAILQTQLIDDILDISRIMHGKLRLNLSPVDLISVISAVIDTLQLEAKTKNIQLEFIKHIQTPDDTSTTENYSSTLESDAPQSMDSASKNPNQTFNLDNISLVENKKITSLSTHSPIPPISGISNSVNSTRSPSQFIVAGDSSRLQQVIWNLLSNAIKFTNSGGKVEIHLEKIDFQQAKITIKDTGIGIKPEFLPYVFDRFRQADGSTTRHHGGLGLGLSIVRYLVEIHHGTISAISPGVDQGATFCINLPLLK
ncbi:ATP-binding protein [Calothrix sp. PCC 6303]|uniref:hybrid sensor histidine kinase/response regulator n=1 Tax=Calothrix sp. PCC 6303 TaxID=1170562 RepID=UPI0002A00687|nr:ATP-binding protein [Calothrix sp. PCC 6303]AFZ00665.1 multi-sensor signal transduction histidine kinase [Calothrix sp. PCC 6303]